MTKRCLLVSVIIPAYNCGRFIGAAIDSVVRQRYPKEYIETIVVDDGSTDNTADILKGYAGKVIYLHQDNKGIASARNRGLAVAHGEIITFLDADDLWHADRLRRIVDMFVEKDEASIVYHPIALVDSSGFVICENFLQAFGYRERVCGSITNDIVTGRIFCGGSSFAFRRGILKKVYPLPEEIKRGVDYYMTVLSSYGATAEYIPEVLGAYRSHEANISMFAGFASSKELSMVYRDFGHTHLKILEKLNKRTSMQDDSRELTALRKIQTRENIFSCILSGRRYDAIKSLPFLFRKINGPADLLTALAVTVVTLFIPGPVFYRSLQLKAEANKRRFYKVKSIRRNAQSRE